MALFKNFQAGWGLEKSELPWEYRNKAIGVFQVELLAYQVSMFQVSALQIGQDNFIYILNIPAILD